MPSAVVPIVDIKYVVFLIVDSGLEVAAGDVMCIGFLVLAADWENLRGVLILSKGFWYGK